MDRNVTPKGKGYGKMISTTAGVGSGLSEVDKFDPAATQPKTNATSQRPLPQPIASARSMKG